MSTKMKRASLPQTPRGRGRLQGMSTRTSLTRRGGDKLLPLPGEAKSARAASQAKAKSLSSRKASNLIDKVKSSVQSRSAPSKGSKSVLKRPRTVSPRSSDSVNDRLAEKRQKLESGATRRSRSEVKTLASTPAKSPKDAKKKKLAEEMKRLLTTEGFWASSNPTPDLDGAQQQLFKRAAGSKRPSKTTTPEASPVSTTRRKSASGSTATTATSTGPPTKPLKASDKEQHGVSVQVSELRRLQTTDGFWSPSITAPGLRSDSRDASPSSTSSSLERGSRHSSRSLQRKSTSVEGSSSSLPYSIFPSATTNQSSVCSQGTKAKSVESGRERNVIVPASDKDAAEMEVSSKPKDRKGKRGRGRVNYLSNTLKRKTLLRRSPTRFGKGSHRGGRIASGKFVSTHKKVLKTDSSESNAQIAPHGDQSTKKNRKNKVLEGESQSEVTNDENLGVPRKRQLLRKRGTVEEKPADSKEDTDNLNIEIVESVGEKTKQGSRKVESSKSFRASTIETKPKSSPVSSVSRKPIKTPVLQKKALPGTRQTRHKTVENKDEVQSKLTQAKKHVQDDKELLGNRELLPGIPLQSSTASKLAISDLLGSGELKRLNTTPGFWAPTPDVSHVLTPRSLDSRARPPRRTTSPRRPPSPKKPESSLLQIRKKKLCALQKQRQIKQQTSRVEHAKHDALQHQDTKPKKMRYVYGRKKRKYPKDPFRKRATQISDSEREDPVTQTEDIHETKQVSTAGTQTHYSESADPVVKGDNNEMEEISTERNVFKDFDSQIISEKSHQSIQLDTVTSLTTACASELVPATSERENNSSADKESPETNILTKLTGKPECLPETVGVCSEQTLPQQSEIELSSLKEKEDQEVVPGTLENSEILDPDDKGSLSDSHKTKLDISKTNNSTKTEEKDTVSLLIDDINTEAEETPRKTLVQEINNEDASITKMDLVDGMSLLDVPSEPPTDSLKKQDEACILIHTEEERNPDEKTCKSLDIPDNKSISSLIGSSDHQRAENFAKQEASLSNQDDKSKADTPNVMLLESSPVTSEPASPSGQEEKNNVPSVLNDSKIVDQTATKEACSTKTFEVLTDGQSESLDVVENNSSLPIDCKIDVDTCVPSNDASRPLLEAKEFCGVETVAPTTSEKFVGQIEEKGERVLDESNFTEQSVTCSVDPLATSSGNEVLNSGVETDKADTSSCHIPDTAQPKRDPLRRVYKKRRNTWQKGVVKRAAKMYKSTAKSTEGVPSSSARKSLGRGELPESKLETVSNEDVPDTTASQALMNSVRAAKKTAKEQRFAMLKRLQTDANLVSGILDESKMQSRSLRDAALKSKTIPFLRKELACDDSVIDSSDKFMKEAPQDVLKKSRGRPKKPCGRPKKLKSRLPKLTLSSSVDRRKSHGRWFKTPPKLSPQHIESTQVPSSWAIEDSSQEAEYVTESVDESDLHLYLSGVSDEEPSPAKSSGETDLGDVYKPALDLADASTAIDFKTKKPLKNEGEQIEPQTNDEPNQTAAQPKTLLVTKKIKGRKGRPPGTPMTEEEKLKIKTSLIARYDDQATFKVPRTARKSTFTPSLYLASTSSPSAAKKFSLRQKTTRSPLEMLEMKRKQEEAIYDMEEEKRLAKRINRMERRLSQVSADDLSADECEYFDEEIKECSVILNDFVKKLHLESVDFPPETDHQNKAEVSPASPDYVGYNADEDWCADLEDFQENDAEWSIDGQHERRPFIPRLKLKRVPKHSKEKKSKTHKSKKKPKFILPKQNAQEPLKLVIKTEALSDNQESPVKHSAPIDVSKVQRQGFEGSFVDFLQGRKTDDFMNAKGNMSRKVGPSSKAAESFFKKKKRSGLNSDSLQGNKNDSHLIMNLGNVGNLTSKSHSAYSVCEKASISNQLNDEIGAMQSSYDNPNTDNLTLHNNSEDSGAVPMGCVPENGNDSTLNVQHQKVKAGIENKSSLMEDIDSVNSVASNTGGEMSVSETIAENEKDKQSTESLTINNNVVQPSLKSAQQTEISQASKGAVQKLESGSTSPKRPAACPCPDGWKVKVIQLADKQPSGRKFTCRRCSFSTSAQLTMESHIYSHIPGVQFRCAYCESEFSSMTATASHMKNTHRLSEACLHISRHVDERSFYASEDAPADASEETSYSGAVGGERVIGSPRGTQVAGSVVVGGGDGLGQGSQSPPVVISVLVSSGTAAAGAVNHAGGVMVRPGVVTPGSAPQSTSGSRRRYVCTHCGFSTSVMADAEHHVLDLHPDSSIFACTLCKENTYYSEAEIRQHSSTVHPSRLRPYRRLPDFYDAEKLSSSVSNSEDACSMGSSSGMFQEGHGTEDSSPVDHRQRAKDYLHLQEGLKEKCSAEADSTTAVDYPECVSEPQAPSSSPTQVEAVADSGGCQDEQTIKTATSNSAADGLRSRTEPEPDLSSKQGDISSSAVGNNDKQLESAEGGGQDRQPPESWQAHDSGVDEDEGNNCGLKIVQVVSLSEGNNQDLTEQNQMQPQDDQSIQEVTRSSLSTVADKAGERPISSLTPATSVKTVPCISKPYSLCQGSSPSKTTAALTTNSSSLTTPSSSLAPVHTQTSAGNNVSTPSQPGGGLPLSYKCSACKVHTPYLLMMVKHLKAKHPLMGCFSCPYCKISASTTDGSSASQPESFVSQKQLRTHIRKHHPDKTGRNEIALSARAKQFVEAMVLPAGPECIRVGNRLVLEEDIHTCTYCSLKMTSLASVYEHLNEAHVELFEFVCPMCQSFKSKELEDISRHSLEVHHSEVETDKVHVSVPKNLFSVLKCISKGGRYIEKHLDSGNVNSAAEDDADSKASPSPAAGVQQASKLAPSSNSTLTSAKTGLTAEDSVAAPLDLTSPIPATPIIPPPPPAHMGINTPTRVPGASSFDPPRAAQVNFSSSLFDTSSLTAPPQLVVSPVAGSLNTSVPAAAACSFLSPQPQKSPSSGKNQRPSSSPSRKQHAGGKQTKSSPSSVASKSLPVLNVPTIKPRPSPSTSVTSKSRVPVFSETVSKSPHQVTAPPVRAPVISHTSSSQPPQPSHTDPPSTSFDDLPEDEPNPDAFKIFNLQPTQTPLVPSPTPLGPLHSSSPSALPSPAGTPSVFPPVSTPLNAGFIQGPIVGFPAGMMIPQTLLSPHAPSLSLSQQQQMQQALLRPASVSIASGPAPSGSNSNSDGSNHRQGRFATSPSASFIPPQRPQSASSAVTTASTALLKEKQRRELLLLKQQHQQQRQFSKEHSRETVRELRRKELEFKEKILQAQAQTFQQFQQRQQQQQQQQLAHRQQMFQRAVLNQQQQARILAQHAQRTQEQAYPQSSSASPQVAAWLQQQHQEQHHQKQQSQKQQQQREASPQSRNDFLGADTNPNHHRQASDSPSHFSPSPTFSSSPLSIPTSAVAGSTSISPGSSTSRLAKGIHKRSSSMYQCPYCPSPVTLKALDVASHIQQKHPGKQVVFKRALS